MKIHTPKILIILTTIKNNSNLNIIDISKKTDITYSHVHKIIKILNKNNILILKNLNNKRDKGILFTPDLIDLMKQAEVIENEIKKFNAKINKGNT